jgi:hypothetical protein
VSYHFGVAPTVVNHRFARSACFVLACALVVGAPPATTTTAGARPPAVQKMDKVNDDLARYNALRAAGKPAPKVTFEFTEQEMNQYMAWALKNEARPGVDSIILKFFEGNYISSYSVLDFDAVERWQPGTIPRLLRPVLSGKRALWVDLRFTASGSHATYTVEKAFFDKLPVPTVVVEKVIAVIAARQPEHYDTTKPIPLPLGIDRAWTRPQALGAATN